MGAIQFIENLDRTSLTISDPEFEINVEMAVSAIAERHREDTPLSERHSGSQLPRDAEIVAHALAHSDKSVEKELDGSIAMTGLLRSMQKPLTSMGRIFSDEKPMLSHSMKGYRLGDHPRPSSVSSIGLSPVILQPPRDSYDARKTSDEIQHTPNTTPAQAAPVSECDTQVGRSASEMAQVRRLQRDEHNDVVELVSPHSSFLCAHIFCPSTLASMFPGLDKELIDDVVRMKQGR